MSMWTQVECRGQIAVGAEVPSTLEQKEARIPGPEQGQSGGSTKPLSDGPVRRPLFFQGTWGVHILLLI